MVSQQLIQELRVILKEDYKCDLPLDEVSEIANTLVNFFTLLAKVEFENE